jgi:hypothetical protein
MSGISRSLSAMGAAVLAAGILTALAPVASAHDVYPPGWNKPAQNVPKAQYDFRVGWGWDDYQRYWPDQTERHPYGPVKSRPVAYGPTIYQMVVGGERYHMVTPATTQSASTQPAMSSQSPGTMQKQ